MRMRFSTKIDDFVKSGVEQSGGLLMAGLNVALIFVPRSRSPALNFGVIDRINDIPS